MDSVQKVYAALGIRHDEDGKKITDTSMSFIKPLHEMSDRRLRLLMHMLWPPLKTVLNFGCWIEGERTLFLEELALLGAARLSREGGGCFGWSSRCAGLPLIERGRRVLWGGSSRCAGLLDR